MVAEIATHAPAFVKSGGAVKAVISILHPLSTAEAVKPVSHDGHLAVSESGAIWRLTDGGLRGHSAHIVGQGALSEHDLREAVRIIHADLCVTT